MQLRALAYADWRALVNDARRVVRSPGRLMLWIAYVLGFVLFFVSRFFMHARLGSVPQHADVTRADYFMCALLVTLALSLAGGPGAIGIFRTRVEARFIIGSPVAAPLAIAYLQLREALGQGLRLLVSFIYFIFIFGPRGVGPVAVLADLALILAMVSAAAAIVVPRRLLPRPAGVACALVGGSLALVALAPAVRDAVMQSPVELPAPLTRSILAFVPAWHPGMVLLQPNPLWLLAVLAVVAAAIAVLASAGRDAYPELYSLSIARIDRRERRRQRRDAPKATPTRGRRVPLSLPAPAGVLVFVWKSVIEFGRQTRTVYVVGGAVLWCAVGFGVAHLPASEDDVLLTGLFTVIINVMVFEGIRAASTIAVEIRRPLFWLARAALFERLCALALARIWRPIATLELIALSFALGGGKAIDTLVFAIGLPALFALLASIGFAAYALFPNAADLRGPITALRLGVSVILLVPPLVLFGVGATALQAPPAALGIAALLAFIEAGALIGVAAWRLDGHIDRLPA